MGDKDFESIFGGWGKPFLIPQSSIEDYEEVARFIKGDRLIMPDNQDVPKQTIGMSKDRIPPFSFDIPKENMEHFLEMLVQPLFKENDTPLIARLRQEIEKQFATLIIEGQPKVNKPKNLKYPHKRRKKRILKKWAKRFGTTPN